jgi:hypothetical protein
VARQATAERDTADQVRNTAWHPPHKPPQYGRVVKSHWHIFHEKLREAEDRLKDIEHLLGPLGEKVIAAKSDEPVEVETDVDEIAALVYRHNDAMERARQAWLDGDLGGDTANSLNSASSPARFGLPMILDDAQATRAKAQRNEITKRLKGREIFFDNLIFAMEVAERVGEVASLAIGAGFVVNAVKTGGKIALVKIVSQAVIVEGVARTADAASQAIEDALLNAGVSEETISNIHTAAAVVEFVLELKRTGKALPSQSKRGVLAATSGSTPGRNPKRSTSSSSASSSDKSKGTSQQGGSKSKPQITKPPRKRDEEFKVDKHKNHPSPRPPETNSHHGVISKWMETHFPQYDQNEAPTILMSAEKHRRTYGVLNSWRARMRARMGGELDWTKITESDMRELSEEMFDAANVPSKIRQQYWKWFARMIKALSKQ